MIIRAQATPWRAGIEFLISDPNLEGINGGRWIALPAEFVQVDPLLSIQPTAYTSIQAAQVLMDDLWHAGLRPTEGAGSAGALAAVQRHLEDMRTLVFKGGEKL